VTDVACCGDGRLSSPVVSFFMESLKNGIQVPLSGPAALRNVCH
jgi:hypothetical protein